MIVMDVDLSSYSAANWARLQPAIHIQKTLRYRVIDRRYRRLPARASSFAKPSATRHNLIVSIGFEDPELIDWQARLVAKYLSSAEYVVVDNSQSAKGAQAIRAVCEKHGCGYLLTPENPWRGEASRSHGLALNWALDNVVRPSRPAAFGFVDADIFPLEPTDPFESLGRQDFFGVIRHASPRWFLWAGFCFFNFPKVERLPLDFGQAWFLGMDTGGANWSVLYRNHVLSGLKKTETSFFPFRPGLDVSDAPMQKCGAWIHEVGQMGRSEYAREKREALKQLLAPHLYA